MAQTDPLTGLIGLTGIPFVNVFNACATGAATIQQAANAILAGTGDIVVAVGMDKHPRGSFKVDPTLTNVPAWYGENGQFVTTKFFGMKINRVHARPWLPVGDAGQSGGQELPQRRAQSQGLPSQSRSPKRRSSALLSSTTLSLRTCSVLPTRERPQWCSAGPTSPIATPTRRCT